jgi:hypothetical protein
MAEALGRHVPSTHHEDGRSVGPRSVRYSDEGTDKSAMDPAKARLVLTELSPRGRRLLDELSRHPDGVAVSEIRFAMGLPPSAPFERTIDAVDAALVEAGLPGIVPRSGQLSMDSMLASSWRKLREPVQ